MAIYDNQVSFDHDDDHVVVVIGSGAGGGTLANKLAQQGIDVVILEAGSLIPSEQFIADEFDSLLQLAWLDPRTSSGDYSLVKSSPTFPAWLCKAVGGTTIHWAGASLRFKEHELKAKTTYGDIAGTSLMDWPLSLQELEPYYDQAERMLNVTRTHGIPGLPANNNFKVMHAGASKVGYSQCHTGRMAINTSTRDGRAYCRQRGFCFQGCIYNAKWSTLYTEIPEALATRRVELRPNSFVTRIEHDDSGKASGVVYIDAKGVEQRQKARLVAVAGNAIETARLLLNSESARFPQGLANGSDQVGRNYMRHVSGAVYGVYDEPVHYYKGTTMAGIIEDESGHDAKRDFAGGYYLETLGFGLAYTALFIQPQAWGRDFTRLIDNFNHLAGAWICGEDMPQSGNRVTLNADVKDGHGLPVANVHYSDHENDIAIRNHAYEMGGEVYRAAGTSEIIHTPPYPSAHNMGTCRMSADPDDGVCNKFGQSHEVPNLFISDGSQFVTSGACNPTLTIVALAIRQADHIREQLHSKAL